MISLDQLGPLQRAALLAAHRAPGQKLTRTTGGWWAGIGADGKLASFTVRPVNALDRAHLLHRDGEFGSNAELTAQGAQLIRPLLGDAGKASAA